MNFFKLKEYISELNNLENKKKEIKSNNNIDYIERKIMLAKLQEQENQIVSYVKDGIEIKDNTFKNEVIEIVVNFLCKYGCSKDDIIDRLSNIKLFTSDTKIGYGSLLVNFGNNIGIDFSFIDFTSDGYFKNFKNEDLQFLKYTLTHEMLHKCSIFKNDNCNVSFSNDALSEGFTDMLALMATNGYEYASKNYDFFVRICSFFTDIIGIQNIIDDYVNNIGKWPRLKSVFYQCGLSDSDFIKFMNVLNKLLELTFMANDNKDLIPVLEDNRNQIISFLRSNILEKIINKSDEKSTNLDDVFNQLFYDFNQTPLKSNEHSI